MLTKKVLSILSGILFTGFTLTAQVKINASTFGAIEARAMGPGTMSGRITAIEGVNAEPKTIYIGTAGGGIWKSTNACASFKPIFDKYCQAIGALAIDQQNPKIIYAGTGESNMRNSVSIGNGIYKSNDAGENWIKIGLDSTEHISKIMIDPQNNSTVYVAVPGPLWSDSKHRGLYKSNDGGKNWSIILYVNEKTGCADFLLDPSNSKILYATTWEFRRTPYSFNSGGKGSAIYKSEDAGITWRKLTKGLPEGDFGRVAIALAPSAPENLLAIVESNATGLYISSDKGERWKQQSATFNVVSRPFYFSTLVIDPKNPKRVYRPALNFSYSDDGGYSFNESSNDAGWVHSDHHALWINPQYTDQLFLGTDGGVFVSNDRGATFSFCPNLPVGQFYHVAIDTKTPYNLYGGLQDNGSWIGPSELPGGVSNGDWKMLSFGDGFWTVPDPSDPNTVYSEYQGGNIMRIDVRTFKSISIKPQQTQNEEKLRWNWNTPISASNKNNLYVGSQYLFKSTDQGRNWTRISPDLSTNDPKKQEQENSGGLSADNTSAENHCTIFTIAESPLNQKIIWVGTDDGNIQVTVDGGKNWNNITKNIVASGIPKFAWVSSIEPSHFDEKTVFATFDHHMYGDHQSYLAKSLDFGKTWVRLQHKEITGFAHKIKEDHVNKNLLFLGTEMGLFASLDGGNEWFRMKNKIPDYALVRDIQIHPREAALIVGTHGRGIYILDDISLFRNMTHEIANQEIVMFDIPDITLHTGKYGGGSPFGGKWDAPNPSDESSIVFYMRDRLMSGEVSLEILDEYGKLVQRIPCDARKGINKVNWNLRMKPPKVAEGGTKLDFGGFIAPMVLPGNYSAKLKLGNKEFTKPFTCIHKDTEHFTLADRKKQFETSLQYYHLHEQLARLVDEINQNQKSLKEEKDLLSSSSEIKKYTDYYNQLEELRFTLLASKNKSVFADEKKLREEITDAYGSVVSGEARPSNLTIERANDLESKVQEAKSAYLKIQKKYDPIISGIKKKLNTKKDVKP